MGWAISWVAVQGPGDVLGALGLRAATGPYTYAKRDGYGFGSLPQGWTLIVSRDCDEFLEPKRLQGLKGYSRAISAGLEEHVMYSGAAEWRDGQELWRVEHLAEDGAFHLATNGTLPPAFTAIRDEHFRLQQADGDVVDHVIDVPLKLAERITGFNAAEGQALEAWLKPAELLKKSGLFGLFS